MSKVVATTLQNGLELSKVQPLQTRVLESILITSFAIVTVFTILPCEYIDGSPIPTLIFRGRPSTFHAFVAFLVFAFSSSLNALLIHNKPLILARKWNTNGPKIEVEEHVKQHNSVSLLLDPEKEAIHLIAFVWWIEQVRMRIEPSWEDTTAHPFHSIQIASLRSVENDHRRIRSIITDLATSDPPIFPSMDLLRLLFWNCRDAGNNTFKRNLVEIIKAHKPEIIVLMETKVAFSKLANFFNRLGFTASTIIDPVGRVRGIWIIWDTTQVNVRASTVNPQVIHATVHKEDYDEWVLAAVYASPNPNLRDQLWHNLENVATNLDRPWLVAGDFNDYANQN
ncbi:unnamed protein product [Camellia sinensis]